ncbi:DUF6580 family putative transport protein [Pseudobdellovibrio exovorus]|uniref:Uncharacterized protein n=1 Tax=Pseudobdellovibrio exovorus JSS TaxID=1184267 RepID=M4VRN8_9BACT|nr:DUF6580 family putative transport protein [Pseudobdellovibrio exovorus]AGH95849.1 hypothetical protein A11Q_1633 [Pseudobdellovibrio exovorus JSS]
MKNKTSIIVFATLFLMAILSRWVSHYWNFTVLGGAFLLAGAYFADKKISVVLMLMVLLVSDAVIGFHAQMPAVYFSYFLVVALGFLLKVDSARYKVFGCALLGSALFYLITNFAVWYSGTLYPLTLQGLKDCYVMGLPFYRNQLIGDLMSSMIFFEVARRVLAVAPSASTAQQKN